MIELKKIFSNEDNIKIIHLVNKGYTTWFEVACVISDFMNERANDKKYTSVSGIKSSEWPSPPRRPQDSRLLSDNIVNINMPFWRDSLNKAIKAYLK